ncbi:hypothetical protein ACKKBG_A36475 [Auxenochlorella protothecoides x Auxenochlorella symbiontica]
MVTTPHGGRIGGRAARGRGTSGRNGRGRGAGREAPTPPRAPPPGSPFTPAATRTTADHRDSTPKSRRGGKARFSPSPLHRSVADSAAVHGRGAHAVVWEEDAGGLVTVTPHPDAPFLLPSFLEGLAEFLSVWQSDAGPRSVQTHVAEASGSGEGAGSWSAETLAAELADLRLRGALCEAGEAASAGPAPPTPLSLRLERLELGDEEVACVAAWCLAHRSRAAVRKLWLFDNKCGDRGAVAVAGILHLGLEEIHLSHNQLTMVGARALMDSVQSTTPLPAKPLWLRLEWNRISLTDLGQYLEAQHAERGLLADIPEGLDPGSTPALPHMPSYLAASGGGRPGPRRPSRGHPPSRNKLRFLVHPCHVRLPWLVSQFELPAEAAVLRSAKLQWQGPRGGEGNANEVPAPAPPLNAGDKSPSPHPHHASSGPLLLFPDTSALLAMLGARRSAVPPCWLTLERLAELTERGQFGRTLPSNEQVFIVVTDSVVKQLDGLKGDAGFGLTVRRFFSKGLDTYGPAGLDILTVLGAHEGEGLLVEAGAEVTGSRSTAVATKGQRTDHRIVEVALYFQNEIRGPGAAAAPPRPASMPVVLLSGDNAQVQLARSHGLPALKPADLNEAEAALARGAAGFTAGALRAALGQAACAGLGSVASHNAATEFEAAVAALLLATDALQDLQTRLEGVRTTVRAGQATGGNPAAALEGLTRLLDPAGPGGDADGLVTELRAQLARWSSLNRAGQGGSRLLRWSGTAASSSGGTEQLGAVGPPEDGLLVPGAGLPAPGGEAGSQSGEEGEDRPHAQP